MFIDGKGIVFISSYNSSNFQLGSNLCTNKFSIAGFWGQENLKQQKLDYMSTISGNLTDFGDRSFIIPSSPDVGEFLEDLFNIIIKAEFEPHYIIAKGTTTDVWPIAPIKKKFHLDSILVLILDYASPPIEDFEMEILDAFDIVFSMGPSANLDFLAHKTIPIFDFFESDLFNPLEANDLVSEKSDIILCSSLNFVEIRDRKDLDHGVCSFIDVSKCPDSELSIYLKLANNVIDCSDLKETDMLLKKIGKIPILLKEYLSQNDNNISEIDKIKNFGKNIEEFSIILKKQISDSLEVGRQAKVISGFDI